MTFNLSHARFALLSVVVFCVYFFSAFYAIQFDPVNSFAVFFWPAAGVGLAAVYFGGYRAAVAVAFAAFLANYLNGAPLAAAIVIGAGNALEAVAGVYFLTLTDFDPLFKRLRDSLVFTAVSLSSSLIAAIIGATTLVAAGALGEHIYTLALLTWWVGDALGILLVGAFLIRWFCRPVQFSERTFADFLEYIFFFSALAAVVLLAFWDPIPHGKPTPFLYLSLVPLAWGALRIGPRMMSLAIVVVAGIAISGALSGHGPYDLTSPVDILLLQIYLGTVGMISLFFVATVEERKDAIRRVQRHVEELQEDVEEISAADRAKNEFIAILSHELRNPLAPVLSSLELMQLNADKAPDFKGAIATMHDQIGRITRLLDDLLDITRIARKKFNLKMESVRVQDILSHCITMASEIVAKRGHRLTTDIPEEPIWLEGDRLRLEQVFVNLLNNAAKYTEPGGAISLIVKRADGVVDIRVRDTGVGIPPDMLRVIFEPFRQVHGGVDGGAGLGIGLSLAKRFVELHGGSIEATSPGTGRGSEFIVRLPIRDVKLLAAAGSASPPVRHEWHIPKRRRSVLIVDDNKAAAEAMAKLLRYAGHRAEVAYDSAHARQVLADFRPDIVLLDIGLPGESGYDFAQALRRYLDPPPYLVALTGFGQESDVERSREAGFDEHLTKPISIADLEKILARGT